MHSVPAAEQAETRTRRACRHRPVQCTIAVFILYRSYSFRERRSTNDLVAASHCGSSRRGSPATRPFRVGGGCRPRAATTVDAPLCRADRRRPGVVDHSRRGPRTAASLVICDTGPLVSALNRGEGARHRFAATLLARIGTDVVVPWPVFTEVDLLLRGRGHTDAATVFASALRDGVHRLDAPTDAELAVAIGLAERYPESGADLPDLSVMAMAARRKAPILTWDYRHFRSVVLRRGQHWRLVVEEHELPPPR